MKLSTFYSCYYIFIFISIILINKIKNKTKFKMFKYNDKHLYFKELPIGLSGVIFNEIIYIYDKESLTVCGGIYEPVFEIKEDNKYYSKCFIAEHIVKHIFKDAPITTGIVGFSFPNHK